VSREIENEYGGAQESLGSVVGTFSKSKSNICPSEKYEVPGEHAFPPAARIGATIESQRTTDTLHYSGSCTRRYLWTHVRTRANRFGSRFDTTKTQWRAVTRTAHGSMRRNFFRIFFSLYSPVANDQTRSFPFAPYREHATRVGTPLVLHTYPPGTKRSRGVRSSEIARTPVRRPQHLMTGGVYGACAKTSYDR
jgi:hypothetical protein